MITQDSFARSITPPRLHWEVQHNTPLHAPPHIKPLRYQVTRDPVLLHLHEVAVSGGGGGTGGRRREGTRSGWRGRCQAKKGSIPEERDEFCVNRRMDTKERWMWGRERRGNGRTKTWIRGKGRIWTFTESEVRIYQSDVLRSEKEMR